jgi:acetyl esterase/lipase
MTRALLGAVPAVLLGTALTAQSRSPLELATATVPPGAIRLAYGSDPQQFGELRVPAGPGPHPVAIVFHGGCWAAELEAMDPRAIAIDNMRPMAAALTEAGIATWNVEYRRLGSGGGWPATFQDAARAADFVRTLAAQHRLDLTRVVATGHSAGGQLAMWLAMRHRLPISSELHAANPLKIAGVVNLDGPVDPARMHPLQERVCGRAVITELMGGAPEDQPARYRHTTPENALPLGVPQIIFTGRVFGDQARAYAAAAAQAGDRAEAIVDPDASHFVFIDPQSPAWPAVLRALLERAGVRP